MALRELDLEIRDGEFFCLLGPSGCGKTTTLNLIGGFVVPTEGTIWLHGQRIDTLPPHKRPVNTVFQSYALFPHMTVLENVGFGLRMDRVGKADARRRAQEALALVGLEAYGERSPAQLSGGQQQRVAVARALVKRPSVLLLDEPLGALDLKLRQRLQLELTQIHREVGTTFVYVTHDQEEAMSMADRIAVLDSGRIEQLGTPQEIYRRPASRFVADFIGHANFLDVTVDGDVATLADGTRVPCAGGRPPGPATLMLRPEVLRLADAASSPPGALLGRTVQASFLGDHVRVTVACGSVGASVDIALHGQEVTTIPAAGTAVAIVWDAGDGALLEPARARGSTERERGSSRGRRLRHGPGPQPIRRRCGIVRRVPAGRSPASGRSFSCRSRSSSSTASGRWSTTTSSTTGRSANYDYFFSVSTYVTTMWATLWVAVVATAIVIAARLSVLVLALAVRRAAAAGAAPHPRGRAVLDELPPARVLVADDPRRQGRPEPIPPVDRDHEPPDRALPLRPSRRSSSCSSTCTSRSPR